MYFFFLFFFFILLYRSVTLISGVTKVEEEEKKWQRVKETKRRKKMYEHVGNTSEKWCSLNYNSYRTPISQWRETDERNETACQECDEEGKE